MQENPSKASLENVEPSRQAQETIEIERKYDATPGMATPSPQQLKEIGFHADPPQTHKLHARYYDTPHQKLGEALIAVRNRTGGKDPGWHMKQKTGPQTRHATKETHWPQNPTPPQELLATVQQLTGENRLEPLADIETVRQTVLLRETPKGQAVIELAFDTVTSLHHASGTQKNWVEWEAELAPGAPPEMLTKLHPLLCKLGATPSKSVAKIARALPD